MKSEGIINYLINAHNDQLSHPVVDIPANSSVTEQLQRHEMQIMMAKSVLATIFFPGTHSVMALL